MKAIINILLLLLIQVAQLQAQQSKKLPAETKQQKDQRMDWWRDARFGLFIHWGLYSVPAGVWKGETNHAEWIRTTAQIPLAEYEKFLPQFNPVKFNADEWVKLAKEAGMKYIVITSKHHDGFCLFDTKQTDFDIMSTPFHRDVMKELSDACRKESIRLCFYHSIMDWHHPDYLPRREWEKDRSAETANMPGYITYMKKELKELLTNYGKIGVLWFDGEWENTWTHERGKDLYKYVRSLQPDIIINNRVDVGRSGMAGLTKPGFAGDFGTPEQEIPATGIPNEDWESCMTMNNNWGYNRNDNNWKSPEDLVQKLVDIASKGGNFLLNVGPTSEGLFPQQSIDRLKAIGSWMKINGESIYETKASPFKKLTWGRCTQKQIASGTRLYLHVFDWPADNKLIVPGMGNKVTSAYPLFAATLLKVERKESDLVIDLSPVAKQDYTTVIVLDIKGKPVIYDAPEISASSSVFLQHLSVSVTTKIPNAVIHFTTNGDEPTMSSPVVKGKITVVNSSMIKAKCFLGGRAISETATERFEKVMPAPAMNVTPSGAGVNFSVYDGKWTALPDFGSMKPAATGTTKFFDISARKETEEYGFVFEGLIKIPADGIYTFYISSDDGSKMFLDDKILIDNDGLHGMVEKEKEAPLAKGYHSIRVEFFERSGGDDLEVQWQGPGIKKQNIPTSVLFRK
jgi:alpha-L-fucosidase